MLIANKLRPIINVKAVEELDSIRAANLQLIEKYGYEVLPPKTS